MSSTTSTPVRVQNIAPGIGISAVIGQYKTVGGVNLLKIVCNNKNSDANDGGHKYRYVVIVNITNNRNFRDLDHSIEELRRLAKDQSRFDAYVIADNLNDDLKKSLKDYKQYDKKTSPQILSDVKLGEGESEMTKLVLLTEDANFLDLDSNEWLGDLMKFDGVLSYCVIVGKKLDDYSAIHPGSNLFKFGHVEMLFVESCEKINTYYGKITSEKKLFLGNVINGENRVPLYNNYATILVDPKYTKSEDEDDKSDTKYIEVEIKNVKTCNFILECVNDESLMKDAIMYSALHNLKKLLTKSIEQFEQKDVNTEKIKDIGRAITRTLANSFEEFANLENKYYLDIGSLYAEKSDDSEIIKQLKRTIGEFPAECSTKFKDFVRNLIKNVFRLYLCTNYSKMSWSDIEIMFKRATVIDSEKLDELIKMHKKTKMDKNEVMKIAKSKNILDCDIKYLTAKNLTGGWCLQKELYSIKNKKGNYYRGIYKVEQNKEEKIVISTNTMLVLDVSTSMNKCFKELKEMIRNAINFIGENDKLSVILFSDVCNVLFEMKNGTEHEKKNMLNILDKSEQMWGGCTNIYDTVKKCEEILTNYMKTNSETIRILLIHDGYPNCGNGYQYTDNAIEQKTVLREAFESLPKLSRIPNVLLFPCTFGGDVKPDLLLNALPNDKKHHYAHVRNVEQLAGKLKDLIINPTNILANKLKVEYAGDGLVLEQNVEPDLLQGTQQMIPFLASANKPYENVKEGIYFTCRINGRENMVILKYDDKLEKTILEKEISRLMNNDLEKVVIELEVAQKNKDMMEIEKLSKRFEIIKKRYNDCDIEINKFSEQLDLIEKLLSQRTEVDQNSMNKYQELLSWAGSTTGGSAKTSVYGHGVECICDSMKELCNNLIKTYNAIFEGKEKLVFPDVEVLRSPKCKKICGNNLPESVTELTKLLEKLWNTDEEIKSVVKGELQELIKITRTYHIEIVNCALEISKVLKVGTESKINSEMLEKLKIKLGGLLCFTNKYDIYNLFEKKANLHITKHITVVWFEKFYCYQEQLPKLIDRDLIE